MPLLIIECFCPKLHVAFPPTVPVDSYYVEISSSFNWTYTAEGVRIILIAGLIPAGLLLLLVLGCVLTHKYRLIRRQKSASIKTEIDLEPIIDGMSSSDGVLPSQEYVLSSDVAEASSIFRDLRKIKTLGSGNFGEVFLGQTQAGDLVAVKRLNPGTSKEEIGEQHKILSEAELMMVC